MTDDATPENLRKFLESDDPALVKMGISMAKGAGVEVTIKDLDHFLKSENVETIKIGVMLADEAGIGDEAMEMLCKPLEDEDEWVRFYAAGTLGEIGDTRAVEPLIKALGEKHGVTNRNVSKAAILALEKLEAIEQLLKALGEGNLAVVEALGKFDDVRAVEPLIRILRGEDQLADEYAVRKSATYALVKIGDAAVEPLIGVLSDNDVRVRIAAAAALGKIGDARAVEPLIKALGDEHNKVRIAATYALGMIADVRAVEPLIKALEDEDEDVHHTAAWALGKIGDVRAVEPLIKALEDGDRNGVEYRGPRLLHDAAKEALKKLGHEME